MNEVFLDTGYVLALELANDRHHRAVRDHWGRLLTGVLPPLVTTSYVFCEIVSFIVMQRLGIATAFTIDHHFEQAGFQIEP